MDIATRSSRQQYGLEETIISIAQIFFSSEVEIEKINGRKNDNFLGKERGGNSD